MVELIGQSDDSFVFDKQYSYVFAIKENGDFHSLDKAKLFALNFTATLK